MAKLFVTDCCEEVLVWLQVCL